MPKPVITSNIIDNDMIWISETPVKPILKIPVAIGIFFINPLVLVWEARYRAPVRAPAPDADIRKPSRDLRLGDSSSLLMY